MPERAASAENLHAKVQENKGGKCQPRIKIREEKMLPEFFATLVIDEDKVGTDSNVGRRVVKFDGPEDSVLLQRPAGWFLSDNLCLHDDDKAREILQYRATYAYFREDFSTALDIYLQLLENDVLKRSSRFEMIDAIIRCELKILPFNGPKTFSLLNELCSLVSSFGQQLQYWSLSLEVYLMANSNVFGYLRNAILLCASIDLPDYWIALSRTPLDSCTNLRIGSLCRAMCLLKARVSTKTECFDVWDVKRIKVELQDLCNDTKLSEAEAAVCNDLVKTTTEVKLFNSSGLPDFLKGVLKNEEAQAIMIRNFYHRFIWLFSDFNEDLIDVLLQNS